ncbi:ABC transporter permease [Scatolibacter rhodanostii]|uniref:ABC transporter permease n=1 Tax=Scatolibacter rhodanostii TaxID=2014781 RepID=UPI000C088140|nr:ABC transporter permease [Scatolibacter rhodanostii]
MRLWKKSALIVLFSFLYFAGMVLSLRNIQELKQVYPGWSLRSQEEISAEQVLQSRRAFAEQADNIIWPTFWTEQRETMTTFRTASTQKIIYYDGDPTLVFPAEFLMGGYPGEMDVNRAAISNQLAFTLWGSEDVLGESFQIGEKEYTISGVFQSKEETVIAGNSNTEMKWKNIEIRDTENKLTREEIVLAAQKIGLSSEVHIIDGNGMVMLLNLFAYLPIVVGIFLICFAINRQLPQHSVVKNVGVFLFFLILALSLPWVLSKFPLWLLPTKWSDFAFWVKLFETLQEYIVSWFLLVPQDKDLVAKMSIIKSMVFLVITFTAEILLWKKVWSKTVSKPKKPELYLANEI